MSIKNTSVNNRVNVDAITFRDEDISISYITDLSYNNYHTYTSEIIDNVKVLVRVTNMNLLQLSKLSGVSRVTLENIFKREAPDHIYRFSTISKLNNFIFSVFSATDKSATEESVSYEITKVDIN